MDKKPQVFPNASNQQTPSEQTGVNPLNITKEETVKAYGNGNNELSEAQLAAAAEMHRKTEEQIKARNEQMRKNLEQADKYEKMLKEATEKKVVVDAPPVTSSPITPAHITTTPLVKTEVKKEESSYIEELSQPDFNSSFDVIPLPSDGKIYREKRPNVRVSYMTTADENILTSSNLLQSGEFLEILINRKLLEPNLRYKDLHVGDRNAIMLWLRATGYGEMYPVTLLDENDVAFETTVNLNNLKYKPLGAEPDAEGLFDFTLPTSKTKIKFKFLTVGDIDDIERQVELDKANNLPVNNTSVYTMEKTIVEVNGNRDEKIVKNFARTLRLRDGKELRDYINKIESGVDLNIEIGTPGGGSIKTFLPLNVSFFWPNISV